MELNTLSSGTTFNAELSTLNSNRANEKTRTLNNNEMDKVLSTTETEDDSYVLELSTKNTEESKQNGVDHAEVSRLLEQSKQQTNAFKSMVTKLLKQQAQKNAAASGTAYSDELDNIYNAIGAGKDVYVEIDAATKAEAKEMVGKDGYFGVEKTSQRLLDFATAIAGDDPKKLSEMKKAFQDGFDAATEAWGDELPQISQDTYDAVMKGFEELENKGKGEK
ncbi:MAG: hypothetical protein ACK5LT_11290 [Lachnospirales bacterium]